MQAIGQMIADVKPMPGQTWRGAPTDSGAIHEMRRVRLTDLDVTVHPLVKTAVDAARRWAERYKGDEDKAPSLVLAGPPGVGKTHIARSIWWAVAQAAVDDGGHKIEGSERPLGRFLTAADLMAELDPQRRDSYQEAIPVSLVLGTSPLIVVDDVGAEGVLPYVSQQGENQEREKQARYFRLIDFCYGSDIPVIITTNLTIPNLAAHVGPRVWDRLNQMAPAGQMVSMFGVPSWRVKAGGR